jgi:hypothetical protein
VCACTKAIEQCNGRDDDCNGAVDEGEAVELGCPPGGQCNQGVCSCDGKGGTDCSGECVDLSSDPLHCGDCRFPCPEGWDCIDGLCKCEGDKELCTGMVCVDTANDPSNCGGCRASCPLACVAGACVGLRDHDEGSSHTCAVLDNGQVRCWGRNDHGQLGDGTQTDRLRPTPVEGVPAIAQVRLGANTTCARSEAGEVFCWGDNYNGQVGNSASGADQLTPVRVDLPPVASLSLGYFHSCAVLEDGRVMCWGMGNEGTLGNGQTSSSASPVEVSGLADATEVACGWSHSCALRADRSLVCWGRNFYGELGNPDGPEIRPAPGPVSGLTDVATLDAGQHHTCAAKRDGTVWCWGYNNYYQVFGSVRSDQTSPVQVSLANATELALGETFSVAVAGSRYHYWGSILGDSYQAPFSGGDARNMLRAGRSHFCVMLGANMLGCFGSNSYGKLGGGTDDPAIGGTVVAW